MYARLLCALHMSFSWRGDLREQLDEAWAVLVAFVCVCVCECLKRWLWACEVHDVTLDS